MSETKTLVHLHILSEDGDILSLQNVSELFEDGQNQENK